MLKFLMGENRTGKTKYIIKHALCSVIDSYNFCLSYPITEQIRPELLLFGRESGLFEDVTVGDIRYVTLTIRGQQVPFGGSGEGLQAILPRVTYILATRDLYKEYRLQNPENNLHPRTQVALGRLLYEEAIKGGDFWVETHSDYIVNAFQMCCSFEQPYDSASILWFTDSDKEPIELKLQPNGALPNDIPREYRQWYIDFEMCILGFEERYEELYGRSK